jgi:hypothetical protein
MLKFNKRLQVIQKSFPNRKKRHELYKYSKKFFIEKLLSLRLNNFMNMNVRVTRANINRGEAGQPAHCPIANALRKQLNGIATRVSVLADRAFVELKQNRKIVMYQSILPKDGTNFVRSFDRGLPVTPVTLKLNFKKTSKAKLYA